MHDEDDVPDGPQAVSSSDSSKSSIGNNPKGINQYKGRPSLDDPSLQCLIREYHRTGMTNREQVSKLLLAEHGITLSATSVKRCRQKMGLNGSGVMTKRMDDTLKRQLVLDQMAEDPTRRSGPRMVKELIARETGVHLTREYVEMEMRLQDPDGFALREPTMGKVQCYVLTVLGPHHEWSGNGHDKLTALGFPIWGIRDVWSGKWLGLWVVPSNRLKVNIAYLYLSLIEELGGMPIQTTTDCGSETVQVYGFASALREAFSPDLPVSELPAHRFLKSIHNTTIERGWLRLRLQWGDNIKIFWDRGWETYGYNGDDAEQSALVRWLWPKLIQQELDILKDRFNSHKIRKDRKKYHPSGCSPNVAVALCHEYGSENCLQPVDSALVRELMEELGGEDLIHFVSAAYADRVQAIFDRLHTSLTLDNVWHVFSTMLPLMRANT